VVIFDLLFKLRRLVTRQVAAGVDGRISEAKRDFSRAFEMTDWERVESLATSFQTNKDLLRSFARQCGIKLRKPEEEDR
jgi:hypothetical protein